MGKSPRQRSHILVLARVCVSLSSWLSGLSQSMLPSRRQANHRERVLSTRLVMYIIFHVLCGIAVSAMLKCVGVLDGILEMSNLRSFAEYSTCYMWNEWDGWWWLDVWLGSFLFIAASFSFTRNHNRATDWLTGSREMCECIAVLNNSKILLLPRFNSLFLIITIIVRRRRRRRLLLLLLSSWLLFARFHRKC